MYSIGEIKKLNQNSERDEANRLAANYTTQENGDVWIRSQGKTRIIEAGAEADAFLAEVKNFPPGQLRVAIEKRFAVAVA